MCGISGLFRADGPIGAGDHVGLARMMHAVSHRGPDDDGLYDTEHLLLGHRRLSIIDLSTSGRQPMSNETKDVWLTFNGEIYNFRELRRELRSEGHVFRSDTDAEVLVHGYESWGLEPLLARLRGMFAFALYDHRRRSEPRLYLARDRFGIKPLYYHWSRGTLVFASELSALIASGRIDAELAPDACRQFLQFGSIPQPGTALANVHALPSAHFLAVDRESFELHRYWRLPDAPEGGAVAIEEVAHTLEEAVRLHLVSDVPLGVFSSGGMDSATLVALASSMSDTPVTTVAVTFDDPELDEGRYARVVSDAYGAEHREVHLGSQDLFSALPEVWRAMDSPTIDGVNAYFVSRAAKQAGLKVVLTGLGGDEVFLGYPHFKKVGRYDTARWWLSRLPRWSFELLRVATRHPLSRLAGKLDYLGGSDNASPYWFFRGLFSSRQVDTLLGDSTRGGEASHADDLRSLVEQEFAHYLENQLLRDTDVMSMAHSIEARVPFLDHRLVEVMFRIPHEKKLSDRMNKPLLYDALSKPLPRAVWDRPKQGFTLPFRAWMLRHRDALRTRTVDSGLFREQAVTELWRLFEMEQTHWSRPWALLVFSQWVDRLKELSILAQSQEPLRA